MKNKWMKGLAIACVVCVILGGASILVGFLLGADIRQAWKQAGDYGVSTKDKLFTTDKDSDDDLTNEDYMYTEFDQDHIQKINADLKNVDLDICVGDTQKITVAVDQRAKSDISVKNNSGTLEIIDHRSKINKAMKNLDVELTLPVDLVLNEIDLQLGVGDVDVEKLQAAQRIRLQLGTGDVDIEELTAKDLDVDCGVGDLYIGKLDIHSSATIEGGVGDTEIGVAGQESDYDYEIEAGVGSVQVFDSELSGFGNKKISNGSGRKITLHSGVGDMTIDQASE